MANLTNNQIPVALPAVSRLDLSCDHVTTMSFGRLQPVHYRHPIKGERINLQSVATVRPFPMACPTYGRMRLNLRHFFVPWRVVFPQFDTFINDTIGVNYSNSAVVLNSPIVKNDVLTQFFLGNSNMYSTVISTWNTGDPFDFYDGTKHYAFTRPGKEFFKILTALGYTINWSTSDTTEYSALPILAFCKIYIDWYANQSYMDGADVIDIKKLLAYNDPTGQLALNNAALTSIASYVGRCIMDQDYFTGAWDNPFAPNAIQFSAISFTDINSSANIKYDNVDVTPAMYQNAASNTAIGTQYLHDALKAITDYSKRHQLAGATNINRALAQYGFGVAPLRMDRSLYLGGSSIDVKTGAVYSTANTASSPNPSTLGDYAGNGFGQGSGGFDFKVEEHGILISIASLLPSGGYFQGMDRNNMVITKRDFWTPEFDGLGVQPIQKREVYVSRSSTFGTAAQYDGVFGFTGRYGEKKRPRSWVSGDLVVPTRFNGGSSWHLMRMFEDSYFNNTAANITHSEDFTRYQLNDNWNRIFTVDSNTNDKFIVEFHHDVHAVAPCHGLFETYEFEDNGKKVNLESNGAVLN